MFAYHYPRPHIRRGDFRLAPVGVALFPTYCEAEAGIFESRDDAAGASCPVCLREFFAHFPHWTHPDAIADAPPA